MSTRKRDVLDPSAILPDSKKRKKKSAEEMLNLSRVQQQEEERIAHENALDYYQDSEESEDHEEKKILIFIFGPDDDILKFVKNDGKLLKTAFSDFEFCSYIANALRDMSSVLNIIKEKTSGYGKIKLIIWYSGHGLNLGSKMPAFKVKGNQYINSTDLFKAVDEHFHHIRQLFLAVDACNMIKDESVIKVISEIEDHPSANHIFDSNFLRGYATSSAYKNASGFCGCYSAFTYTLVKHLNLGSDLRLALYRTRMELGQEPYFKIPHVVSGYTLVEDDEIQESILSD